MPTSFGWLCWKRSKSSFSVNKSLWASLSLKSARGQIAIPAAIRKALGLEEGSKLFFFLDKNALVLKKIESMSFSEVTRPLKEAAARAGLQEKDVVDLVHQARRKK